MLILIFLLLALAAGAANPEARPYRSTSSQGRKTSTAKSKHTDRQRGTPAALPGTESTATSTPG